MKTWRLFVRGVVSWTADKLKRKICMVPDGITRRRSYTDKEENLKYDILSYQKNFDEGSWQEE